VAGGPFPAICAIDMVAVECGVSVLIGATVLIEGL
jgi:hypothetical protein